MDELQAELTALKAEKEQFEKQKEDAVLAEKEHIIQQKDELMHVEIQKIMERYRLQHLIAVPVFILY